MNNSYILLRNNKESGSLSLDALLQLGLKPNDLIWVECQSVTWRHPHEIAEFKGLVLETPEVALAMADNVVNSIQPQVLKHSEKKAEKKNVLEELLAEVRSVNKTEDIVPFEDLDVNGMYQYAGIESKNSSDKKPPIQNSKIAPIATPFDDAIEFPQQKKIAKQPFSLDEIQLPVGLKKIAVYAGFILIGALLMFFIKGSGKKEPVTIVQSTTAPAASNITEETMNEEYSTPVNSEQPGEMESLQQSASSTVASTLAGENSNISKKPLEKVNANKKKEVEVQDVSEHVKPVAEQPIETKPEPVENISSKLSLKANDYGLGSFGGIKNLEVTLHNNSKYLLDKVTAEIRYLNPEGAVVLTDHVNFQSVQPGEIETLPVNKTKRGVKVSLKIIKIESKEINGSTAGL